MSKRSFAVVVALALGIVLVPGTRRLLAQAPQSLSVLVNGYVLHGKALWYKGKVYVPLEDLATSTGGSYNYDPRTRVARATVGRPLRKFPGEVQRPVLKVVWQRKYTSPDNARVLATIANEGQVPANDVQVICIFKDETLQEISASTRNIGNLNPGQRRTVEFQLFGGGMRSDYPGYSPVYPWAPSVGPGEVLVDGTWTRISYELKFNYN